MGAKDFKLILGTFKDLNELNWNLNKLKVVNWYHINAAKYDAFNNRKIVTTLYAAEQKLSREFFILLNLHGGGNYKVKGDLNIANQHYSEEFRIIS